MLRPETPGPLRRLLVTGASGLLGSNLAVTAAAAKIATVGVVHRHLLDLAGVDVVSADLTQPGVADALVRDVRPDWVIHCAAATDVDACEEHPERALQQNTWMSGMVADAARSVGAGILYVSTDSVFSGEKGAYREEDATSPLNAYARSKLAGEEAVRLGNPRHLIVRTNIFGWNARDKRSLAEWVLSRLEEGTDVPGFLDVFFNPLLVNDLADVLFTLLEQDRRGTVHAAAADTCSKYGFARTVAQEFGFDASRVRASSANEASFRAPRPRDTTLDAGRLADWLGRPLPTVQAGVQRMRALRDAGFVYILRHGAANATTTETQNAGS